MVRLLGPEARHNVSKPINMENGETLARGQFQEIENRRPHRLQSHPCGQSGCDRGEYITAMKGVTYWLQEVFVIRDVMHRGLLIQAQRKKPVVGTDKEMPTIGSGYRPPF